MQRLIYDMTGSFRNIQNDMTGSFRNIQNTHNKISKTFMDPSILNYAVLVFEMNDWAYMC